MLMVLSISMSPLDTKDVPRTPSDRDWFIRGTHMWIIMPCSSNRCVQEYHRNPSCKAVIINTQALAGLTGSPVRWAGWMIYI